MQLIGQIALASAAFASLSAAIPLEKRGAFTVKQAANTAFRAKSGPAALAKVYRKYGVEVPQDIASAAGNDGTVPATPVTPDVEYLCPVSIGNNQTLNLDFDTGSADLWVFSSKLPTASQQGHSVFNPAISSTFQNLDGYAWKITYADGSGASGSVGLDTVTVGGTTVQNQAVEMADTISAQFGQGPGDGLLGLSYSSINTVTPKSQLTFFDNAKSSLSSPLFTADLKKGVPGSYDFGFIDKSKYQGDLTYTPVNSGQGFWEFTSSGYQIGTGALQSTPIDGIADTGTTLVILDDTIVQTYYSSVQGAKNDQTQGGYTFPCTATLPDFTFVVGSYNAVIPGSIVNFAPVDSTGVSCFGGIQPKGTLPFSIWGDIMFKAQFVVFDGGNNQLGFAAKP